MAKKQAMGWTTSTLTEIDLAKTKEEGFLAASAEVIFPSTEVIPHPHPGFRVMFLAFLFCVFLFLPMNFFMGYFLFTACSYISSRQIQSCIFPASSLYVKLSWASIHTGAYGSIYLVCTIMYPRKKFTILAAPSCLFNQNPNILHLRWLNRFRIGGRSGSTLKTTNLLKSKNMNWVLLIL
jgi:hypothetical protein